MKQTIHAVIAAGAFVLLAALPGRAETFYLFSSDRAVSPLHGSGIHRYSFDSEKPMDLKPAPSAGQQGDIWGESAGKPYLGKSISGIAIAPNGDVYAVDNAGGSVLRFDGETGAFKGEVAKGLDKPDGITFGPDGNLYISNSASVVRFSSEGKPLPAVGQIASIFAEGLLQNASGLTFGPDGNLYVCSQANGLVVRYDGKTGQQIDVFCKSGITAPSQLAFGADGHLYVASSGGPGFNAESGYVAKFDGATGAFLGRFAAEAKGAIGLAFGPANSLFVTGYFDGQISGYDASTGKKSAVLAGSAPGSALYYLAVAKRPERGARLSAWTPKAPRLAPVGQHNARPASLNLGADTVRGWQNGLRPAGTPGPLLALAADKKSDYSILLPANASTMDQKAAAMLVQTLQQMTGATLRQVTEGSGARLGRKVISIGRTNHFKAAGLKEAKLNLGDEGYAIAAKGENLYIIGGRVRGAMYGVVALLEEDLGCRWYAPGAQGARIPHRSKLSFRPALRHFVPVLTVRDPYYADAFNSAWSLMNKTNSPNVPLPQEYGGYAKHALFVHTYNALVPPEEYFATHPEYYAEVNGKRQPTQLDLSNPEVLRITIDSVRKFLRDAPGSKFISVSPNDGRGYCECAICSALDKAEATEPGSKSGSLINFCNKVAAAIEPEFPDVKITTLAYLDTFMPPKTIRPHKNVVIQLCTDSHAWKYQFDFITESEKFQTALKAWHTIKADMYIWDYTTDFVHYMVPMPNMPVVTSNIKFYMDHGARGVMLQGSYQSPGGENGPMRSWVWAKQLWNPNLDTKALMKDFVFGYYGEAAEPIWKYNMLLWQIWEKNHAIPHKPGVTKIGEHPFILEAPCSTPPDWEVLTPQYIAETKAYFEQAEKLAKDPVTRERVQVAKLSTLYVELGQSLGYIEELGGFKAGSWAKTQDPKTKPYYEALFREFDAITTNAHVTSISEHSSTEKLTSKWRDILDYDKSKISPVKLSQAWKFSPDADKSGEAKGWHTAAFDDSAWAVVRSDKSNGWESQGFADYKGVTWYRQKVTIPADFNRRKNRYLLFSAVDSEAEVYINGVKAFEHTIASTGIPVEKIWNDPFAFDPTPYLKVGEENTIAVRVSSFGGVRGVWQPVSLLASDDERSVQELINASIVLGQ